MSVEARYDTVLKDMITLLQEALCRFFTDKEVDASKFKHYFAQFHKGLATLQEGFHEKATKFSKSLNKLAELFEKNSSASKFSLQPTPSRTVEPSQLVAKPKTAHNQVPLNIIGEVEEEQYERQKRSGTAEGKRRQQNFVIDFSEGKFRPKTGISRGNNRYRHSVGGTLNSQTISHEPEPRNFRTFNSRDLDRDQYEKQPKRERKSFYNDLQKETRTEIVYENMVKIPKKKSISTHRWSFKINKLF